MAAKRLARSDLLDAEDGRTAAVTSITERKGRFPVYNLEVAGAGTYYAGEAGWWVHNACSFEDMMDADEARRYRGYWERGAPQQVEPGTGRMEWGRYSGRTGRYEESTVIYDDYGRQRYRVDHTDHMRPSDHSNPHLHEYEYGPGYDRQKGKEMDYHF